MSDKPIPDNNRVAMRIRDEDYAIACVVVSNPDYSTKVEITFIGPGEAIEYEIQLDPRSALMFTDQIRTVLRYSSWATQNRQVL